MTNVFVTPLATIDLFSVCSLLLKYRVVLHLKVSRETFLTSVLKSRTNRSEDIEIGNLSGVQVQPSGSLKVFLSVSLGYLGRKIHCLFDTGSVNVLRPLGPVRREVHD